MGTNTVPGIDGQGRPNESEGHCLDSGKRLAEHGNAQQQHAGRSRILDKSQGGQGDALGAEIEKQQGGGRKNPRAQ